MRVQSRIVKSDLIDWRKAKVLQNDNLKDLDDEAKERLKRSFYENNFVMPFHIWFDEKEKIEWILDGTHRQRILSELAEKGIDIDGEHFDVEVPDQLPANFIRCEDKQAAAKLVLIYSSIYAKISQEGLSDFSKLHNLNLDDYRYEIDLPEFSMPRFEQKFAPAPDFDNAEDDDAEENEFSKIVVAKGDIFLLGKHKIACTDCLNSEIWKMLLEEQKADIVFTDPPYNLPADFIGGKGEVQHEDFKMAKGEMTDVEFKDFIESVMLLCCEFSKNGSIHYICMDFRHTWHMTEAARKPYGTIEPKQICVWNKSNGANGSFYRAKHEFIFIYKNGKAKHFSNLQLKDRVRYNVWDYQSANSIGNPERHEIRNHPTPKPTKMVYDVLLDVTKEKEIVLDLFLGSGTTLIAAEQARRICYATDIEPKYIQNTIARYYKYCKKNGVTFHFKHLNGNLEASDIVDTIVIN